MRKLLALVIVLAFVSVASANSAWFEVEAGTPTLPGGNYSYGQIIQINLVADFDVMGVSLDVAASFGELLTNATLNGAFGVVVPGTLAGDGSQISFISGLDITMVGVTAGDTVLSFDYQVPHLPESVAYIIDNANYTAIDSTTAESISDVAALQIHAPEPMTIGLLGLGGLFLRRRK